MTNKRTRKAVIYKCDRPGCTAKHVAPFNSYKLAWPHAKAAGWITAKHNDQWFHFCDWVHRPANERQFQQMLDYPDKSPSAALGADYPPSR